MKRRQYHFTTLELGDVIGQGCHRTVYAHATNPRVVIKLENQNIRSWHFQNVLEFLTWRDLDHSEYRQYLAPCRYISPDGTILVQDRVSPLKGLRDPRLKGVRLPEFLTDFKLGNYGILRGKVVACDYGNNLTINHGAFASKLRRPKWRAT